MVSAILKSVNPGTKAVVIGASAGAIEALMTVLPMLPESCPFPVIVVVHLPAGRPSMLVELFVSKCRLPVNEPNDKQPVSKGVWFAPPNYHLLIESDATFSLSVDDPHNFSRPSIDVLFESAADVYGESLVGVVLTGANSDGAAGASAIRAASGFVVVQSPETAEAVQMPQAALGSAQLVGSLQDIAVFLRDLALTSGS
jgi:two-component system, chemotaxis family, protein-glutamate methylesterase/glutaminase